MRPDPDIICLFSMKFRGIYITFPPPGGGKDTKNEVGKIDKKMNKEKKEKRAKKEEKRGKKGKKRKKGVKMRKKPIAPQKIQGKKIISSDGGVGKKDDFDVIYIPLGISKTTLHI